MNFISAPGGAPGSDTTLTVVLLLLALVVFGAWRLFPKQKSTWRPRYRHSNVVAFNRPENRAARVPQASAADPTEQMRFVSRASFKVRPLLNREEYPVLQVLERTVRELGAGHRVMAQTSLGEIIEPEGDHLSPDERKGAFASINSKRLDFAVFDRRGIIVLAVEYQGTGHYHEKSFMRDAVKREALRKAGVPFLEVPARQDPAETARQVRSHLGGAGPESGAQPDARRA